MGCNALPNIGPLILFTSTKIYYRLPYVAHRVQWGDTEVTTSSEPGGRDRGGGQQAGSNPPVGDSVVSGFWSRDTVG